MVKWNLISFIGDQNVAKMSLEPALFSAPDNKG